MKRKSFKPGALTAPIPPAMVTVGTMERPNVLTVAWTGILATHPPKTYVSIRPSRHSYGMLKEGGEFVINLPSRALARAVDYVGIYTGKKVDKFRAVGLTAVKSERVAPPTIGECPVALECVVSDVLPMGTHDVFVADIVSVSCREELLDEEGKLHFERGELLAYVHGEYYALGDKVGRFGFSTDKADKGGAGGKARKTTAVKADGIEKKEAASRADRISDKKGGSPKITHGAEKKNGTGAASGAERKQADGKDGVNSPEKGTKKPFYLTAPAVKNKPRTRSKSETAPGKDKGKPKKKAKA